MLISMSDQRPRLVTRTSPPITAPFHRAGNTGRGARLREMISNRLPGRAFMPTMPSRLAAVADRCLDRMLPAEHEPCLGYAYVRILRRLDHLDRFRDGAPCLGCHFYHCTTGKAPPLGHLINKVTEEHRSVDPEAPRRGPADRGGQGQGRHHGPADLPLTGASQGSFLPRKGWPRQSLLQDHLPAPTVGRNLFASRVFKRSPNFLLSRTICQAGSRASSLCGSCY
jgi:hypothetical protein